ncbi:MAG TPA: transaldolase family protein [Bryobacteraceae bacterium]|nr:transaldolase family protein [Bryobacteraceae bacterium]HPQ17129.1 transaldolase family protein [Bryobacteraceae bacterium]HPU71189.1 transaldolase family protein [Bryobacteraceae bacterium]
MQNGTYLNWVITNTKTKWWHDSADPAELDLGLERGAVGVTTNPFLTNTTLAKNKAAWGDHIAEVLGQKLPPEQKAEALMRGVVTAAAKKLLPEYERSGGKMGYVCAQVNPARAGERDCMLPMARRFHSWAPNIAVKLPVTAAGLDVLEDCVAEGITTTATVSFTVPQVVAVAERHRKGIARAKEKGIEPGKCFAVIMIGRLDDYLREVARDSYPGIEESDIRQAGLAVTKRAYKIYQERGYEAVLLIAALRGEYHLTELAGADLVMSIHPTMQGPFVSRDLPREERIDREVPAEVIQKLSRMREFVRAYEPDGMKPEEFISYGATQRTLSQFCEVGWKQLESM